MYAYSPIPDGTFTTAMKHEWQHIILIGHSALHPFDWLRPHRVKYQS